jgi:hypothetical protein
MARLPTFRPTAVSNDGVLGAYSPSTLIGEGWIACLVGSGGPFVWGRFRSVDPAAKTAVFTPNKVEPIEVIEREKTYSYLDSYWGKRAELVLDRSNSWRRLQFQPRDSMDFDQPGGRLSTAVSGEVSGGRIVPGGWDHEHCELCSTTISVSAQAFGFVNQAELWICEKCHDDYVATRSLDFIPEWATA